MRSLRSALAGCGLQVGLIIWSCTLLAGCGSANVVDVKFNGFAIVSDRSSIKTGSVVFQLTNKDGQVLHQFIIVQTDLPADKLPLGADARADTSALTIVSSLDKLDVGQSASLTANLAPGHYVLMCNIVGHYQLGMHTDFTVTP